jgi:nitroimidazol reductase NimA-like FMN-containing flavoprotein (pyridoxamine 5'-phosphate oxidase superfamily)
MMGKLTDNEIDEVLSTNLLGRIGCRNGEKMYVIPVNYVYDGQYILAHSQEGLKIDIMRNNPSICFEVEEVKNFINWRSVIIWGGLPGAK